MATTRWQHIFKDPRKREQGSNIIDKHIQNTPKLSSAVSMNYKTTREIVSAFQFHPPWETIAIAEECTTVAFLVRCSVDVLPDTFLFLSFKRYCNFSQEFRFQLFRTTTARSRDKHHTQTHTHWLELGKSRRRCRARRLTPCHITNIHIYNHQDWNEFIISFKRH